VRAELYRRTGWGAPPARPADGPTASQRANEVAVELFLGGKIRFGRIAETIGHVLDAHQVRDARRSRRCRADGDARSLHGSPRAPTLAALAVVLVP